jgi:ribosomal protein L32
MKKYLVILVALLVAMLACVAVASADEYPVNENAVVGYGKLDDITSIGGHAIDNANKKVVKDPTCTERGWADFPCLTPADHANTTAYHRVYIEPLGHIMSSTTGQPDWGEVVIAPTCTEAGLAVDICLRPGCTYKDWDNTRVIDPIEHLYKNDYKGNRTILEPTCTTYGYKVRVCTVCGHENDADLAQFKANKTTPVVIPMKDHEWSDWMLEKEPTCGLYGEAHRSCIICGALQRLDNNASNLSVQDHGKTLNIWEVPMLNKLNPKWQTAFNALNGIEFKTRAALDAALAKLDGVDYKEIKNWLLHCYLREITLQCPHCKGTVHQNIVYTMGDSNKVANPLTVAHSFKKEREEAVPNATLNTEAKIKDEKQVNNFKSLDPTCNLPGFDIFLCDKDPEYHNHSVAATDTWKKVLKDALGHDWTEWEEADAYTKDGEDYVLMIRECKRCHGTENKVEKKEKVDPVDPEPIEPAEPKNGLVKDEDGVWRYYEDDKLVEKDQIVEFEGGKFWVIKGVLASGANGLTICPDGKGYFLSQGQIQTITGEAEYQGDWFLIRNGELDVNGNGLYKYDGAKFAFAAGKLRKDINGLWQNPQDGKWYFLANGQVQDKTGVALYDGAAFLLKNGQLDTAYEGEYEYDGATFIVINGQLYPAE